jgi:hypothetical protein
MPSQPYEEWSNDLLLHPLTTTNLVYPYYYQGPRLLGDGTNCLFKEESWFIMSVINFLYVATCVSLRHYLDEYDVKLTSHGIFTLWGGGGVDGS